MMWSKSDRPEDTDWGPLPVTGDAGPKPLGHGMCFVVERQDDGLFLPIGATSATRSAHVDQFGTDQHLGR